MQEFKDFYEILKISRGATFKEMKAAYKRQCLEWHPDRNPGVNTNKIMQEINEAKRVLSNPITREKYNQEYLYFQEQIRQKQRPGKEQQQKRTNNEEQKQRQGSQYKGEEKFYEENIDPLEDTFLNEFFDQQIKSKTDKELIDICFCASEYHPVFVHKVVTELKKRKYETVK